MRIHAVPLIAAALLTAVLAACGSAADEAGPATADAASSAAGRAIAAASSDDRDAQRGTEDADAGSATPRERHRRGDRSCARLVTRTRSVASVSGGAMQMIMVTECVPAPH